jgi:hypothetical protein
MSEGVSSLRKTQNNRLTNEEISHSQLLQTIILHIERLGDRMDHTDTKIDELRSKFESADQNRQKMAEDISSVRTEVGIVKASVEAGKNPPWYMGPIPMAVIVGLAFLAGGGFCVLIISQLDFIEPLTKMKGLVVNE